MKSAMYGMTHHDAPASIIACDISFVHAFVATSTAVLRSSLFVWLICFAGVIHLVHQMPRHVDTDVECVGGVVLKCVP
jgi:hypothetical protein